MHERALGGQGGLRFVDQVLKRFWLAHGKISKNFPIEFDAGLLHAVHKLRIGYAMLPSARINTLDPECPEIPFPCATITIGVLQIFFDPLDCGAECVFRSTPRALGLFENFFVAVLLGHTAFYTCHLSAPLHPHEVAFNDTCIRITHNLRAAVGTFHFLRPTPQHVSEVSAIKADLTFGRDFKTLLSAALVFELGHFDFPYLANLW
tara:strand:- start:38780 stop:39397 length:618 start_codon:yes stop_codon:yes gene_type:complete